MPCRRGQPCEEACGQALRSPLIAGIHRTRRVRRRFGERQLVSCIDRDTRCRGSQACHSASDPIAAPKFPVQFPTSSPRHRLEFAVDNTRAGSIERKHLARNTRRGSTDAQHVKERAACQWPGFAASSGPLASATAKRRLAGATLRRLRRTRCWRRRFHTLRRLIPRNPKPGERQGLQWRAFGRTLSGMCGESKCFRRRMSGSALRSRMCLGVGPSSAF